METLLITHVNLELMLISIHSAVQDKGPHHLQPWNKPGRGSNNGNNTLLVGKLFQIITSRVLLKEHYWNKLCYLPLRAVNT